MKQTLFKLILQILIIAMVFSFSQLMVHLVPPPSPTYFNMICWGFGCGMLATKIADKLRNKND